MGVGDLCQETLSRCFGGDSGEDEDNPPQEHLSPPNYQLPRSSSSDQETNPQSPAPLDLLRSHSAIDAIHNSFSRSFVPRCMPGTRDVVLDQLMEWIRDTSATPPMMFLTGRAGFGKTAIAQSVAAMCEIEGILAATFFFSVSSAEQNSAKRLVPTLAYQIAHHIPDVAPGIEKAIHNSVFSTSLEHQMKTLLVNPVRSACHTQPWPGAIVLDGLDECLIESDQTEILRSLKTSLVDDHLPFRVLICTRPESVVREALQGFLHDTARHMSLDETLDPDQAIRTYLRIQFDDISKRHGFAIPSDELWPSDDDIQLICTKASGIFIYAASILKYVDQPNKDPREQLRLILQEISTSRSGLDHPPPSTLSLLYRSIIELTGSDDNYIVRFLQKMRKHSLAELSFDMFEEFLFLDAGSLLGILSNITSIVSIPEYPCLIEDIKFHHRSMVEFLDDPEHSGDQFVSEEDINAELAICCLKHLLAASSSSICSAILCDNPDQEVLSLSLRYWMEWTTKSNLTDNLLAEFMKLDITVWQEVWSLSDPWRRHVLWNFVGSKCPALCKRILDNGSLLWNHVCVEIDHLSKIFVVEVPNGLSNNRPASMITHEETPSLSSLHPDNSSENSKDSMERVDAYFSVGPRQYLQSDVISWIRDSNDTHRQILFITGPGRTGKTTLLKELEDQLTGTSFVFTLGLCSTVKHKGYPKLPSLSICRNRKFCIACRPLRTILQGIQAEYKSYSNSMDRFCSGVILVDDLSSSGMILPSFLKDLHGTLNASRRKFPLKIIITARPDPTLSHALQTYLSITVFIVDLVTSYRSSIALLSFLHHNLKSRGLEVPSGHDLKCLAERLCGTAVSWYYSQRVISFLECQSSELRKELFANSAENAIDLLDKFS